MINHWFCTKLLTYYFTMNVLWYIPIYNNHFSYLRYVHTFILFFIMFNVLRLYLSHWNCSRIFVKIKTPAIIFLFVFWSLQINFSLLQIDRELSATMFSYLWKKMLTYKSQSCEKVWLQYKNVFSLVSCKNPYFWRE